MELIPKLKTVIYQNHLRTTPMKHLFTLFIALGSLLPALAQNQVNTNWCGTPEPTEANLRFLEQLHQSGYMEARIENETVFIPIKIHIIRNSQGVGNFQISDALRNICELNDWYKAHGIQFFVRGDVNFINNTAWFSSFQNGDNDIINPIHNVANCVNVYYVNVTTIGLCGFANFPGTGSPATTSRQGAIYLSPSCSGVGNSTFAHEMGHFLSLPHPFQGNSDNPAGPLSERVTRNNNEVLPRLSANCVSAGDRFCDTPSDYIATRWSCPRTHTQVDINGDIFQPDETLIMGYANDNCHTRFSPQQSAAMRATVTVVNGLSGPRRYLMVPPMEPYDTITSIPTPLEPAANATGVPNNWAYFKWNAVPGATMYLLRLRFNFSTLEEILVSDTGYLYTGTRLNGGVQYRWSVAAINHKVTCINWTADRNFTTVTNGVSVAELQELKFQVYPSLVRNGENIRLRFDNVIQGEVNIQLQDVQGRLVQSQKLFVDQDQLELPLQLPANGLYFVRVSRNGQQYMQKIVVGN